MKPGHCSLSQEPALLFLPVPVGRMGDGGSHGFPPPPRKEQSQPSSVQGRVMQMGKGGVDRSSKALSAAGAPALAETMLPRGDSEGQEVSLPLSVSSS